VRYHRDVLSKSPALRGAFCCYLRSLETGRVAANLDRLGEGMEASVLPKVLSTAGPRIGAAGPVVLHVGVALFTYEPTVGATYEPTDGATDDPYPESPACASAAVLERAKAVANAIVLSFMKCPSCYLDNRTVCLIVPLNLLKRDETPSGSDLADRQPMAFIITVCPPPST
jgi:hypothetical protein